MFSSDISSSKCYLVNFLASSCILEVHCNMKLVDSNACEDISFPLRNTEKKVGPSHVVYPPQIFKKKKKEFNKLLKEKERKMIIKEKMAPPSKVAPFSKTAPGWSRFGSTFFLSEWRHDTQKIHLKQYVSQDTKCWCIFFFYHRNTNFQPELLSSDDACPLLVVHR